MIHLTDVKRELDNYKTKPGCEIKAKTGAVIKNEKDRIDRLK